MIDFITHNTGLWHVFAINKTYQFTASIIYALRDITRWIDHRCALVHLCQCAQWLHRFLLIIGSHSITFSIEKN